MQAPRPILTTERLVIRPFTPGDAPFIVELVNDESWLRFIGDRHVHSIDDALRYLHDGPWAMQARHGFSLWAVDRRDDGSTVGMCGLVQREGLDDVDIGYALLPAHRGRGYAREAAAAALAHAFDTLGFKRIVAITDPDNHTSAAVLRSIGMRFERLVQLPRAGGASALYAAAQADASAA